MPSLAWYRQRLSAMSPAEIPWRLRRKVAEELGRFRHWPRAADMPFDSFWTGSGTVGEFIARPGCPAPHRPSPAELRSWPEPWRRQCLAEAEDILAGRVTFFHLNRHQLPAPIDWSRDYDSGLSVPVAYAPKLDYRDRSRVGDVKIIWELNRLQHLVRLGQAWLLTGDTRFPLEACALAESWIGANPWMHGINWTSAMEAGLRLISLTFLFEYIRDWPGLEERFVRLLAASIHQHLRFVDGHYSLYSSANNHLVAEASGVAFAAAYWSCLRGASALHDRARRLLEREMLNQNHPDGVNKEQAFYYQFFVFDLFLLPAIQGARQGRSFSIQYLERLGRMAEFMAWVTDCKGHTPNVGDQDDGRAVCLAGPGEEPWPGLCHAAGIFLQRPEFLHWGGGSIDERNSWLFAAGERSAYLAAASGLANPATRRTRLFPDGGYMVFRDGEGQREIMALFDVGPHGWPATAAHAHSDALSLLLHVGGEPVLVDPGTHSYRDGECRRFSRSAAAHNTLSFEGSDQAEYLNRFMWGRQPRVVVESEDIASANPRLTATAYWHGGEQHTRTVSLLARDRRLAVEDHWNTPDGRRPVRAWQVGHGCEVVETQGSVTIQLPAGAVVLCSPNTAQEMVHREVSPRCYLLRRAVCVREFLPDSENWAKTEITCP